MSYVNPIFASYHVYRSLFRCLRNAKGVMKRHFPIVKTFDLIGNESQLGLMAIGQGLSRAFGPQTCEDREWWRSDYQASSVTTQSSVS